MIESDEEQQLSVTGPYKQYLYASATAELLHRDNQRNERGVPRPKIVPMHLTRVAKKLPTEEDVI